MKFSDVADYFSKIETVSSRLEMTRLLAELLHQASAHEAGIICYISLGELHAPYIGTQFNLAEKNVAKAIAHLLSMSIAEVAHQAKKWGDMGLLFDHHSYKHHGDISVQQVYKSLQAIEETGGTGSQEEKITMLVDLLKQVNPQSAKYIVRIILGKLRLGFSDMTVVDALSWMVTGDKSYRTAIEDAYNICADIGIIASELKEKGIHAIKHMHAHIGIPIRPAAAERLPTAKAVFEKLGPCVAQPKLDGFRLQIHIDKEKKHPLIKFFSRNLNDMSAMFPDLTEAVEELKVDNAICEGEAIVFDEATNTFSPFQETVKRKRKHGIEKAATELPLYIFLFDLMYINGKDIMDEPHEKRREQLLHITRGLKTDKVKVDGEIPIHNVTELEAYFNECISGGLEGLVVKRPNAPYQAGKRGFNWIKLKRSNFGHLEDTIDAVILGYYAGEGKRVHFGIGAFLVGVYNKKEDRFETLAKIGTGLKDEDWKELRKKCDAVKISHQPKNVVCAKELYPDVWVDPRIVCAIKADEITLSPLHTAGKTEKNLGYALRFPRFVSYRPDKGPEEVTTITEIEGLYKDQYKK